jgi:hypothetical protein
MYYQDNGVILNHIAACDTKQSEKDNKKLIQLSQVK